MNATYKKTPTSRLCTDAAFNVIGPQHRLFDLTALHQVKGHHKGLQCIFAFSQEDHLQNKAPELNVTSLFTIFVPKFLKRYSFLILFLREGFMGYLWINRHLLESCLAQSEEQELSLNGAPGRLFFIKQAIK